MKKSAMGYHASMTDGSFARVGGAFAKQLAVTGGSAIFDGRGLALFSGNTGSEFQVKDTDDEIVTNDKMASLLWTPRRPETTRSTGDGGGTPPKRRKKELTECDKLDAVTKWSKEMMDLRWSVEKSPGEGSGGEVKRVWRALGRAGTHAP